MIESYYPDTVQLLSQQRTRRTLVFSLMIVAVVIVCAAMGGLGYFFPKIPPFVLGAVGIAAFTMMVVPVIIWHNPRFAVYLLFSGVMIFGEGYSTRATIPTSYIPMWLNISTVGEQYGTGALKMFVFTIAEVLMVLATVSWLVRAIVKRELHIERGTLIAPILLYTLMVFYGFMRGMTSGADRTMALYEVRAQATFLLAYLMAANMINDKKQVMNLLWIGALSSGFLAICATVTYFTLPGEVGPEGFLPHDDSLLFNVLFFITIIAMLARLDRRLIFWSSVLTPPALFVALANQRRAGIAAFIIAFLPLMPILWAILHDRRKQIATFMLVFFVAMAVYLPVAWNSDGAWALPARAIRSQSDPSGRDASSDYYRLAENTNLKFTRDLSPWLGYGYGKPYIQIVFQFGKSTDFMNYLPHNGILWVWMRLGHIGFFVFIMMFGAILIKGVQTVREVNDPVLKTAGVMAITFALMIFTIGKYDLVLVMPRQMFTLGVFLGVLGVLKKLDAKESAEQAALLRENEPPTLTIASTD